MTLSIDLNVYHHFSTDEPLTPILRKLDGLLRKVEHMSAELDKLTQAVQRNTTIDGSIVQLVEGLAAQLRTMAEGATELAAFKAAAISMADELDASSDKQAAAVAANTTAVTPPVEPTPPV